MSTHDNTASRDHESYDADHAVPVGTSPWAVISAILAAAAFFLPAPTLRWLFAIAAVVAGHAAMRDIKLGLKGGRGFAGAGLGLGYIAIALNLIATVASNY